MSEYTRFKAEKAIRNSSLKFPTRHLLNVMWQLADAKTGIIPRPISMMEWACHTGMSVRAVNTHITEAEKGGWLLKRAPETKNAIARHQKNRYRLLIPEQVQEMHDSSAGDALHSAGDALEQVQEMHTGIKPSFFSSGDSSAKAALSSQEEKKKSHEKRIHAPAAGCQCEPDKYGDIGGTMCGSHKCPCGETAVDYYLRYNEMGYAQYLFMCQKHMDAKDYDPDVRERTWETYGVVFTMSSVR